MLEPTKRNGFTKLRNCSIQKEEFGNVKNVVVEWIGVVATVSYL